MTVSADLPQVLGLMVKADGKLRAMLLD